MCCRWLSYEEANTELTSWMKSAEDRLKQYTLSGSIAAKQQQADIYKTLVQDVKSHESQLDQFNDQSQALTQATGEGRLTSHVSKLHSRYQSLLTSSKV